MSAECAALHAWANSLTRLRFPFDVNQIPRNGIYLLFEEGEVAHRANRIVRVGSHTGNNQLRSRLNQHFLIENKDRSIFRKNIGRALLNRDNDPFLTKWQLDGTFRKIRGQLDGTDLDRQRAIEETISEYIRGHFSFVVLCVDDDKVERLKLESKMISTVSLCDECQPSAQWLGNFSPIMKIRESGLWLVKELYKEPLSSQDLKRITDRITATTA